ADPGGPVPDGPCQFDNARPQALPAPDARLSFLPSSSRLRLRWPADRRTLRPSPARTQQSQAVIAFSGNPHIFRPERSLPSGGVRGMFEGFKVGLALGGGAA